MTAEERAILHVDMDAFYASVEQRDNPELAGKPLIVGGLEGRGVVAAASYEVRRFGVRSAMPIRRALELCPHAICVTPRMSRYKEVSTQVFAIFHEVTPVVEGLSLDEAFLDVTHSRALLGDSLTIARNIKLRIFATTGLRASVGVASNKLVAKIASDLEKPDGLTVVTPDNVHTVLDPLPVRRLPGLGRKKGEQVVAAGIHTLGELRRCSDAVLWPLFGRDSARMRERASGLDNRPVESDRDELSISAETTFNIDLANPAQLQTELAALADKASSRLRSKQLMAGQISIKIRRHDFSTQTRQCAVQPPSNDSRIVQKLAQQLLHRWLGENPRAKIRLLGVGFGALAPAEQQDLFAPALTDNATASPLDTALDNIRARFGTQAVTRASRVPSGRKP